MAQSKQRYRYYSKVERFQSRQWVIVPVIVIASGSLANWRKVSCDQAQTLETLSIDVRKVLNLYQRKLLFSLRTLLLSSPPQVFLGHCFSLNQIS